MDETGLSSNDDQQQQQQNAAIQHMLTFGFPQPTVGLVHVHQQHQQEQNLVSQQQTSEQNAAVQHMLTFGFGGLVQHPQEQEHPGQQEHLVAQQQLTLEQNTMQQLQEELQQQQQQQQSSYSPIYNGEDPMDFFYQQQQHDHISMSPSSNNGGGHSYSNPPAADFINININHNNNNNSPLHHSTTTGGGDSRNFSFPGGLYSDIDPISPVVHAAHANPLFNSPTNSFMKLHQSSFEQKPTHENIYEHQGQDALLDHDNDPDKAQPQPQPQDMFHGHAGHFMNHSAQPPSSTAQQHAGQAGGGPLSLHAVSANNNNEPAPPGNYAPFSALMATLNDHSRGSARGQDGNSAHAHTNSILMSDVNANFNSQQQLQQHQVMHHFHHSPQKTDKQMKPHMNISQDSIPNNTSSMPPLANVRPSATGTIIDLTSPSELEPVTGNTNTNTNVNASNSTNAYTNAYTNANTNANAYTNAYTNANTNANANTTPSFLTIPQAVALAQHNNLHIGPRKRKTYSVQMNNNLSSSYNFNAYPSRYRYHPRVPNALPSADVIAKSIPEDASSIFHILDRRIDMDEVDEGVTFYELMRNWVRDDPYRQEPVKGGNLLDYLVLPMEQRNRNGDGNGNGDNAESVNASEEEENKDKAEIKKLERLEQKMDQDKRQNEIVAGGRECNIFSEVGQSEIADLSMYLKEYIQKGTRKRKLRSRLLKKKDEVCLKHLEKSLGVKVVTKGR